MKKILAICAIMFVMACSEVAFTGRSQVKLIPDSQINSLSFTQYDQFLSEQKVLRSGPQVDMVKRVGNDIKLAAETYYRANGLEDQLKNFAWEFNVVDDEIINAFCMPGGKVVIYTGIMKVAQDEHGLAVIMGHEVAHALAHHGNERMTQGMISQLGLTTLDLALAEKPAATKSLLLTAAGAATQVGVMLPFSRKHESEADEIGLYLMAMAGYDVTAAAPFWQRMQANSSGQAPPEFLSTHPAPGRRSDNLQQLVPKAREYATKYPVPGSSKR